MTSSPRRVDFLIANDRHHASAALPVIEALRRKGGVSCRVLSLSEFRGIRSPTDHFRRRGVPIEPLVPFPFRRPSAGGLPAPGTRGTSRRFVRELFWNALLAPSLRAALEAPPGLVVIPNDGAYPYDRICRLLRRLEIPFLVLQEGIRFPTPSGSGEGRSGAAAWAAWGEPSAGYFRTCGAPAERVHVTGSPRFDALHSRDWSLEAAALRRELSGGRPLILLLSNPIDDLGLVTPAAKLALIDRLVEALIPILQDRGWHLVVKLHGRESVSQVTGALTRSAPDAPVSVVSDCPLYPLLSASRGALTFASSVGLEAILCGTPLAVVEVPGHGFVHDFVASGAAAGISGEQRVREQIEVWLAEEPASRRSAIDGYLERTVAHRGTAAARVAELIAQQQEVSPGTAR